MNPITHLFLFLQAAPKEGPSVGFSEDLILQIVRMVVAAILGAVGGAYAAGRNSTDTRHTLRGEMQTATTAAAVAFGRLEERVNQNERDLRRVESSVERQFRIINRKLDALMAGSNLGSLIRRVGDSEDDDGPSGD